MAPTHTVVQHLLDFDPVGIGMAWVGAYGLVGLFLVALTERFLPVMPSYRVLLAVGITAEDGGWSLPSAFFATTTGSLFGCIACFYAVGALGDARSTRILYATGRIFGMPPDRIERWSASFRRNQTLLAFSLQIVPTVRLFAPVFAALMRADAWRFLAASAAGILVWNCLFIGIGYWASRSIDAGNTTVLAMTALGGLLILELAVIWGLQRFRARRTKPCR